MRTNSAPDFYINHHLTNFTRSDKKIHTPISVVASYRDNPHKVQAIMLEAAQGQLDQKRYSLEDLGFIRSQWYLNPLPTTGSHHSG